MRLTEELPVRLLQTVLLSALLALSPAAWADATELSAQEVVTAVEATYKDVTAMSADFVQVTRSDLGETRQQGLVQLKRPRMMRWDFAEPATSFITDGSQLWVWAAAENQVIVTEDFSAGSGSSDMSQLLTDLSKLSELFDVQQLSQGGEDTGTSYTLELTPKTPTAFKQLQIVVARDGYTLQRVVMVDSFDGVVELDFSQVRLNPEIADNQFTFSIPEGATVIRTDGI